MKRDLNVEVMRIVACFIVIGVHIKILTGVQGTVYSYNNGFIDAIFSDGVAVFWMIMGFFSLSSRKWSKKIKRLIFGIIIPAIVTILVWQILGGWLIGDTIYPSFDLDIPWSSWLVGLLNQNSSFFKGCMHLWYVFAYVVNFLWLPVLSLMVEKDNKYSTKVRRYVIIVGIIAMVVNIVNLFIVEKIFHIKEITIMSASIVQILIGYELYQKKADIKGKRLITVLSLLSFVLVNFVRTLMQGLIFKIDVKDSVMSWDTLFGTLSAMAIVVFCLSLNLEKVNPFVEKFVAQLGKSTYGIYLVHTMVVFYLSNNNVGLKGVLVDFFQASNGKAICQFAYIVVFGVIVFAISFFIIFIIDSFLLVIRKLIKKIEIKIKGAKIEN